MYLPEPSYSSAPIKQFHTYSIIVKVKNTENYTYNNYFNIVLISVTMETLKERIWRSLREPQKTLTTLQEKFNCQKIDKE